jgi:hypothetical protein
VNIGLYRAKEIDTVVKSVRTEANAALENLRSYSLGKSTGITVYFLNTEIFVLF